MNKESISYQDYCKAENTDDEESFLDLQSRLYAEVYYAPLATDNMDNIDAKNCSKPVTNDRSCSVLHESVQNTTNIHDNNQKQLFAACSVIQEYTVTNIDNFHTHPQSTHQMTKDSAKYGQAKLEAHQQDDNNVLFTENNSPKSQILHNTNIETKSLNKNAEPPGSNFYSVTYPLNDQSRMYNFKKVHSHAQTMPNTVNACNNDDILNKYNCTKKLINQLYIKKYMDLEQKLQREAQLDVQTSTLPIAYDNVKINRRYVASENYTRKKLYTKQCTAAENVETDVNLKENDSESDGSILEVPIPPKPKPPIINLQDSDEESVEVCNSKKTKDVHSIKKKKKKIKSNLTYSNDNHNAEPTSSSFDNGLVNKQYSPIDSIVEKFDQVAQCDLSNDILLNCSKLQKAATNIECIKEMSKNAYTKHYDNKLQKQNGKLNDSDVCQLPADEVNYFNAAILCIAVEPTNEFVSSTTMHKNSQNSDVDFIDNHAILHPNVPFGNEHLSGNRKRQRDFENNADYYTKQVKLNDKCTENNIKRATDTQDKTKNQILKCEENEKVTFSKDSRKAADFDVTEIQSKMSKDPELWAILDEDLMPKPSKKHRFWNVRCTHCHRDGHVRYHCPEPLRPPKCHMCGIQGHTQTRCPKKICLTCGKCQATYRQTCESCCTLSCEMCSATGHTAPKCPDLWRRYHQTTKNSVVNVPASLADVMKPPSLLICCNCTKRGHDSSGCKEYHWSQHFPTPAFVSYYADPLDNINNSNPTKPRRNCVPLFTNNLITSSKDFIPLTVPTATARNPDVLCSYGNTKNKDGRYEIVKLIGTKRMRYYTAGVRKGCIAPTFLEWLSTLLSFHVKICLEANEGLTLHICAASPDYEFIRKILRTWFSLEDDDKTEWFPTYLPQNKIDLIKMLTDKLAELNKNFGNPRSLWNEIKFFKKSLHNASGPQSDVKRKLQETQLKLLMIMHGKPKKSTLARRLEKQVAKLRKLKSTIVPLEQYMSTLITYSMVFVPYTPQYTVQWIKRQCQYFDDNKRKELNNKIIENYNIANVTRPADKAEVSTKSHTKHKKMSVLVTTSQEDPTNVEYTRGHNTSKKINMSAMNDCEFQITSAKYQCNYLSESSKNASTPQLKPKIIEYVDLDEELEKDLDNRTMEHSKNTQHSNTGMYNNANTLHHSVLKETGGSNLNDPHLMEDIKTKSQKKSKSKERKLKPNISQLTDKMTPEKRNKLNKLIQSAFKFQLPLMDEVGLKLQQKLETNTVTNKDVKALHKLINTERIHRNSMNQFYKKNWL